MSKLNKIIIHWTAGQNQPNNIDYQHYHFLINGNGLKVEGKHKPEDNENCQDGNYAQHTGGGNTGAIGVALCGMLGYVSARNVGKYPLKKTQCEAAFKAIAELCKKYKIPVTKETVMTHYEFGKSHPKTTSAGKIDITWLPYPNLTPDKVGDFIRNKIRWYYQRV